MNSKVPKLLLTLLLLIKVYQASYCQEISPLTRRDTVNVNFFSIQTLASTINNNLIAYSDSGNYSMVKNLLEFDANPKYANEDGVTALMYAADNGYYSIAKLLIEYGADVNSKPWDGNSAIFAAVRNNNDSIAELLIKHNANVNEKNNQNLTPLHYAAGFGYPYLTELLITNGARVNEKDRYGNTPLFAAIYSGALTVTDILIESNADVNATDNKGNTPIIVAAQFNDTLLIQKLASAGANIDALNLNGIDALTVSIENNATNAFKKLISLGASTKSSPKNRGYYQFAKENSSFEIANYLEQMGLKTKLKPNINRVNFYSGFSVSNNDFMLDFGGGIQESVSNLLVNIGYRYKPFPNRVLIYRDNAFYQFWEKRYSFYLSLQHLLTLKRNPNKGDFGFIPGISNELSWRYYRGLDEGSGLKYIPIPSIGIF